MLAVLRPFVQVLMLVLTRVTDAPADEQLWALLTQVHDLVARVAAASGNDASSERARAVREMQQVSLRESGCWRKACGF